MEGVFRLDALIPATKNLGAAAIQPSEVQAQLAALLRTLSNKVDDMVFGEVRTRQFFVEKKE